MPVSVTQPKSVKVSSEHGDIINVSIVKSGSEIKTVVFNQVANNSITVAGAIGAGPSGATGVRGEDGNQGPTGADGPQGPAGPTGPTGPAGPAGSNGTNGTNGTDGTDGQGVPVGGTAGQALTKIDGTNYNTQWSDVGSTIVSAITISNNDNAFAHMTNPITSGTSIEAVLRNMLEQYNRTSISMSSITRALQQTGGGYGSFSTLSSNETLEMGQGVRVSAFAISIGDNTQTIDDSVKFLRGGSVLEQGFSDANGTKTLSSVEEQDTGNNTSVSYKATAIDDGGSGLGDQTINSGSITISFRPRLKVGGSTTSSISSDANAQALFDSGLTTAFNALRSESDFNVTANSSMDTALNYTWIAYPASFGNLNKVDLAGVDVLSDFQSPVDYNLTNPYGVTTSYRFYRSDFDKAFAIGQILTIDF